MRLNDRKPDALRPVSFERHYIKHAPGSVLVAFGGTRVICTASYEPRVPPWMKDSGRGWVTAEYAMLPGATHTRGNRDAVKKGRALEISRLIGRALRATVDLAAIGECQIILDCDVIQADGGTRTAAITGAFLALHDALQWSVTQGNLKSMPALTPCAAVSLGIVGGQVLLDLDYSEDSQAEVDLNLVMNGRGEIIEIQASAERHPFPQTALQEMLTIGAQGIQQLLALQLAALNVVG